MQNENETGINVNTVPTFWEIPFELQTKLIKEFILYVLGSIRFRHYVMFFSFWALAFQTRRLLLTYLEFETVVKVDIVKPYAIDLPGVTICTDRYNYVLKSKLEKRYPQIRDELNIYKQNKADLNETENSEEIMKIYRTYKEKAYYNSTIQEWFELMVEPYMLMECKLLIKPEWHRVNNKTWPTCFEMGNPTWSLPYGAGVCWTFFSQVNPGQFNTKENWYQIIVESGYLASFRFFYDIYDDFVEDVVPPTDDRLDDIHELAGIITFPKAIYPIISLDRATIRPGTNYELSFSQTNARLLNWPYITNCRIYGEQGRWKNYKSNYECIDSCLTEKLLSNCHCIYNQSRGERITKWSANMSESALKFCLEDRNSTDICRNSDEFEMKIARPSNCKIKGICNNNCYEEYYRYEVQQNIWDNETDGQNMTYDEDDDYFYKRSEPFYPRAKPNESFATLLIRRKDAADTTYEHTAEMIFVEFVCYFGGLLGLWLGVSILDAYHQILIWLAEAPIEYEKWLERQKTSTNVENIAVNTRNGRISLISDEINFTNNNSENVRNNNIRNIYESDYEIKYGLK